MVADHVANVVPGTPRKSIMNMRDMNVLECVFYNQTALKTKYSILYMNFLLKWCII